MKSYIKIYGPPVLKALKALENIAIDIPEVCIMDTLISASPYIQGPESAAAYFDRDDIDVERCYTIISETKETLGDYDFYFEWFIKPDNNQLDRLIQKIDEALGPLGCAYTITTK
jgi:hypothetical protein